MISAYKTTIERSAIMKKRILISGDIINDHNLVEKSVLAPVKQQVFSPVMHSTMPGGAIYLKEIIARLFPEKNPEVEIVGLPDFGAAKPNPQPTMPASYQIWSMHELTKGKKDTAWRIRYPMGILEIGKKNTDTFFKWNDPGNADLLVIDDLGLGFCDSIKDYSQFFRQINPADFILKTSNLRSVSPLWQWLFQSDEGHTYLDRLTVVLSANALRKRGASISKALSWDMTIEDTVKEMESGYSSLDLALCKRVIIHFDYEGIASFRSNRRGTTIEMEFFLYHPTEYEGTFSENRPGLTFGSLSIITASMAYHAISPNEHPLFMALSRGLEAARINHQEGGGADAGKLKIEATIDKATAIIRNRGPKDQKAKSIFRTAYQHNILADKVLNAQTQGESNLLRDMTGAGHEYIAAKAFEIVNKGIEEALADVPTATYGKYITADREEIERINAVKNLILTYKANRDERKPLSIAVFGSPGSGKSFAIKQLADEIFGKDKAILEYNLSQFADADLHEAFHNVRDASIMNTIPLVFWDEFDSDKLKWLKYFLAPMQDANFVSHGGAVHPFGKAIFIFAGGTSECFEEFQSGKKYKGEGENQNVRDDIDSKQVKKPDFISRLKGYVNIKGPNPVGSIDNDPSYIIRRAIILRKTIERSYKNLLGEGKLASIDAGIIDAFLRVKEYRHGARSLESVFTMSNLNQTKHFDASLLPPKSVLDIHVTDDFHGYVKEGQLNYDMIEVLAAEIHEAWRRVRDKTNSHERDKEYALLDNAGKEDNRNPARLTRAKLGSVGIDLVSRNKIKGRTIINGKEKEEKITTLMNIEHDMWLRGRLIKGFSAPQHKAKSTDGNKTRESYFLHMDVVPFDKVIPKHQEYDRAISEAIWDEQVIKRNYVVVKLEKNLKNKKKE
jgi:hypothetical protein